MTDPNLERLRRTLTAQSIDHKASVSSTLDPFSIRRSEDFVPLPVCASELDRGGSAARRSRPTIAPGRGSLCSRSASPWWARSGPQSVDELYIALSVLLPLAFLLLHKVERLES